MRNWGSQAFPRGSRALPFPVRSSARMRATPQLRRLAQVMQAIESVVALPACREQVLAAAPPIVRVGTSGSLVVFFDYDFHVRQGRLVPFEVNTNAGGAMLNAVLARARRACCKDVHARVPSLANVAALEQRIADRFRREWRFADVPGKAGKAAMAEAARPPRSIAIVDFAPEDQYRYHDQNASEMLRDGLRLIASSAMPKILPAWRPFAVLSRPLSPTLIRVDSRPLIRQNHSRPIWPRWQTRPLRLHERRLDGATRSTGRAGPCRDRAMDKEVFWRGPGQKLLRIDLTGHPGFEGWP